MGGGVKWYQDIGRGRGRGGVQDTGRTRDESGKGGRTDKKYESRNALGSKAERINEKEKEWNDVDIPRTYVEMKERNAEFFEENRKTKGV